LLKNKHLVTGQVPSPRPAQQANLGGEDV